MRGGGRGGEGGREGKGTEGRRVVNATEVKVAIHKERV